MPFIPGLQQKDTPEGTSTYNYNINKQLTGITSPDTVGRAFGYDPKGRISSISETIPGSSPAFLTTFTYDNWGRLSTTTHPSLITETNNYNSNGYLSSVSAGGKARWTILGVNARGQVASGRYGTGLNTTLGYNSYGYLTSVVTGSLQSYRYDFDAITGNLNWRKNILRASIQENFEYDGLNRLDRIYRGSITLVDMAYESNKGGITTKSDVGTFLYRTTNKPYADSVIYPSSGLTPSVAQSITYTSFESISTISEGNFSATFTYNSGNERAKMVVQQGTSISLTRWYPNNSNIKETITGTTKEYTFIGGDAYTAPCVAIKQGSTTKFYYLLRDHLGSITHVVDTTNTTLYEYSYDAWGRMRDPATWVSYAPGYSANYYLFAAGRGFTGHEHLPWFNLINMNGRVYDPLAGQFLSPDNYVQSPGFTQSYNRYGYCLNNPLIYTDPSGEKWGWWLLGDILTGGAISQTVVTTAATLAPISSEQGYELQKYVSPVAIKLDFNLGSIQNGLGFDVSYGLLKGGQGYRGSYGATYYWSNYGGYNGWEQRIGGEAQILPFMSYSGTMFIDGEQNQITNRITLGGLTLNMSYENDTEMPFSFLGVPKYDGGDRYRTASARISAGGIEIGLNLHTGMAGGDGYDNIWVDTNGDGIVDTRVFTGGDIDEPRQRAGVLYIGFGPLRIGKDSEVTRLIFQNKFAHDFINGGSRGSAYPWVLPLVKKPRFFWQFGTGSGNTNW